MYSFTSESTDDSKPHRRAEPQSWKRPLDILFLTEPLWVAAGAAAVYLSILFEASRYWLGAGLAIVLFPFLLRIWRHRRLSRRTLFDIPILLLLIGATIGIWVSPEREASLESWFSLIALVCIYYTLVNYPRPRLLLKWGPILGLFIVYVLIVFTFSSGRLLSSPNWANSWLFALGERLPHLPQPSDYAAPIILDIHGTALVLSVAAAVCLAVALFNRGWLQRSVGAVSGALFLAIIIMNSIPSLHRLFAGESWRGRMLVWQKTLDLLNGSQHITGLGLGYWPWAYNNGFAVDGITHPHSAYVQIYADAGVMGLIAFILGLAIAVSLSWQVLRQGRRHPYWGLVVGTVLALVLTLAVGVFDTAPIGIQITAKETYHYVLSPPFFLIGAFLVILRSLPQDRYNKAGRHGNKTMDGE